MLHLLGAPGARRFRRLADVLQMPQSSVSRHLKLLAGEGWVRQPRRGHGELLPAWPMPELPESPRGSSGSWPPTQTLAWPALAHDRLRLARCLARTRRRRPRLLRRRRRRMGAPAHRALRRALHRARLPGPARRRTGWSPTSPAAVAPRRSAARRPGWRASSPSTARPRCSRRHGGVRSGVDNILFEEGDLERLPVADGACDAALMLLALTQLDRSRARSHRDGTHRQARGPRGDRRSPAPRPRGVSPPDGPEATPVLQPTDLARLLTAVRLRRGPLCPLGSRARSARAGAAARERHTN